MVALYTLRFRYSFKVSLGIDGAMLWSICLILRLINEDVLPLTEQAQKEMNSMANISFLFYGDDTIARVA